MLFSPFQSRRPGCFWCLGPNVCTLIPKQERVSKLPRGGVSSVSGTIGAAYLIANNAYTVLFRPVRGSMWPKERDMNGNRGHFAKVTPPPGLFMSNFWCVRHWSIMQYVRGACSISLVTSPDRR